MLFPDKELVQRVYDGKCADVELCEEEFLDEFTRPRLDTFRLAEAARKLSTAEGERVFFRNQHTNYGLLDRPVLDGVNFHREGGAADDE